MPQWILIFYLIGTHAQVAGSYVYPTEFDCRAAGDDYVRGYNVHYPNNMIYPVCKPITR